VTSADVAVAVSGLTKRFGDHAAVDDISFEVRRGEVFGFVGPNGCGKTTTIRMLCGILEPTAGTGYVLGRDCWRQAAEVKLLIGYMSQRFALYDELTVDENLSFYGKVYGLSDEAVGHRTTEFAERMGLARIRGSQAGAIGSGLRQRLALGCSILHQPPVVFLDEPTSSVDPEARRGFWDLIYALAADGASILVTTHNMDEAEYCHRLALMHEGRLVAVGTPDSLRACIGGVALEFAAMPLSVAADTLAVLPGVPPPTVLADTIHVYVPPTLSEEFVLDRLARAGVSFGNVVRTLPTLDDVFAVLLS